MSTKRGLGKGLDSMIPEKILSTKPSYKDNEDVSRETLLDINKVEPNRGQPRKNFNEDALQELADSIKQYGIIEPIIVKKNGELYQIIAGERRWRASKLAGIKKIPVIVKEYTDQQAMEIALIENIQREDLNPIEEALAYQNLMKEYGLKQDELAEKVSKSRTAVTNSMRLLKLDVRVQEMLIDDMISAGHARTLISIEDGEMQFDIAQKIFDHKLSVRETEKLVKKYLMNQDKSGEEVVVTQETSDDFIYRDLENKIRDIVGTKVIIHKRVKNKGKIEIEYYSDDELERLIELFQSIG